MKELCMCLRWLVVVAVTVMPEMSLCQSQPTTPYRSMPSLAEVNRIRSLSDKTRKLRNFQPKSDSVSRTVFEVGLTYCVGGRALDDGYTIDGAQAQVRLGDMQAFMLETINGDTVRIRLTVMPTISEALLLSVKPSFSDLEESYGRHVEIKVPLTKGRAKACIIGKEKYYDSDRVFVSYLADLALNKTFVLSYDTNKIWWAVPSVISDPLYPYRVGFDAFGDAIKVRDK